ncbi:MAG: hypothetical protein GX992_08705 [Clostridium sp.]|nr:hypothetical protein [Clostridium sp.]
MTGLNKSIEKIIRKKFDIWDSVIIFITILVAFILATFIILITGPVYYSIALASVAVIGYAGYVIITSRNVEYEYSLIGNNLEINMIVGKRKRKLLFSGQYRQFQAIGKASGKEYETLAANITTVIHAGSLPSSDYTYFFITEYKNKKTVVYFEPGIEIVSAIKSKNKRAFISG